MLYPSREEAHAAMITMAQNEFEKTLALPQLTLVENPGTGTFKIVRGQPPIEDGMAVKAGQVPTTHEGEL